MQKKNKYSDSSISILDLDKELVEILKNNNINKVGEIWKLKRKDLKELGFKDSDINQVIIKLQLLGLDLNGRIY